MIIAVFGLPGTGKTYFAQALAKRLNAVYLGSDQVRKDLFNNPAYSYQEKRQVYKEMSDRMYDFLHRRQPLVLDATFYRREIRQNFDLAAESIGCRIAWIEVRADDKVIRKRLGKKRTDSDADFAVHLALKGQFESMRRSHLILLSTDNNLEELIASALDYLKRFGKEDNKISNTLKKEGL